MINQALPQVTIERTLAQLRWRPADFDEATLLRRIAEHPAYWLLLHDGEPWLAPDDRDRRLAAVFTSESARDACLAEPGLAPAGAKVKRCDGRELFTRLRQRHYDGIVFNCMGPDRPLAFVPELLTRLQPFADAPRDRHVTTAAERIDFDSLAADAYPRQQPGERAIVDALWRATFALDEWFVVTARSATRKPFIQRDNDGYPSAFLFTDAGRAARFVKLNMLRSAPGSDAIAPPIAPATVIAWSREQSFPVHAERLHFNFGNPGWFSPSDNLARLYDHLNAPPALRVLSPGTSRGQTGV